MLPFVIAFPAGRGKRLLGLFFLWQNGRMLCLEFYPERNAEQGSPREFAGNESAAFSAQFKRDGGFSHMELQAKLLFFPALLFSLVCHEVGHAWIAWKGGDDTAKLAGRVSLNPMVHLDLVGTVIFPLLQIFTGIPLIGWAKPVPVNPGNLRSRHWDLAVSLAGVGMNLLLLVLAALGLRLFLMVGASPIFHSSGTTIYILLIAFMEINAVLMLFNLLPIPPLDGSHVVLYFIRDINSPLGRFFQGLEKVGFILLLLLVFSGQVNHILGPLISGVFSVIEFIFFFPKGYFSNV
jgi:Zn-dependent protease